MSNGETTPIGGSIPGPPPPPGQQQLESGITLAAAFAGPEVEALVQAGLFLYNLAEWLVTLFSGVPHDAKTLGAGQVLIHSQDPITAYYGGQLISGAHADRVLSESSGMHSFEVLAGSLLDALYSLANANPAGGYWHYVREQGGGPVLGLRDIPPPPGAPYTQPVNAATVGLGVLPTADQYQQQNGFQVPTNQQIIDFINSGQMLTWAQVPTTTTGFDQLRQIMRAQVTQRYGDWLSTQQSKLPPPVGRPPYEPGSPAGQGDEFVDCCVATQGNLQAILTQLETMHSTLVDQPSADCCAQILAELTLIAGAVQALPAAIAGALPSSPASGVLTAIVNALEALKPTDPVTCAQLTHLVEQFATALSTGTLGDLSGVVVQLTRIADSLTPDPAVIAAATQRGQAFRSYLASLDGFPADLRQLFGS
jgi:hypothetical protein